MKINKDGIIISITETELYEYYLEHGMDDIYDFKTYEYLMEQAGTKIIYKYE